MESSSLYASCSLPPISNRRYLTQDLFNRFFIQIYQGCGDTTCSTQLCATARSQHLSRPLRSFTAVSARAFAIVFACSENAHDRLCTNLSGDLPSITIDEQEKLDPKSIVQQLCNTKALRSFHSFEKPCSQDHTTQDTHPPLYTPLPNAVSTPVKCADLVNSWNVSQQDVFPFFEGVCLTLATTLSNFTSLALSFSDDPTAIFQSPNDSQHHTQIRLDRVLRLWMANEVASYIVFDSIWTALEPIFESPFAPQIQQSKKYQTLPPGDNDLRVSRAVYNAIHALTASIPLAQRETWHVVWSAIVNGRAYGRQRQIQDDPNFSPWLRILDAFEQEPALRMAKRLIRSIGARTCLEETLSVCGVDSSDSGRETKAWRFDSKLRKRVLDMLVYEEQSVRTAKFKTKWRDELRHGSHILGTTSLVWLEWLRKCFLKEWDGSLRINRWSVAGSALELIEDLWNHRGRAHLDMPDDLFATPVVFSLLDVDKAAHDWMSYKSNPNTRHLLTFKFLFSTHAVTLLIRTAHHIRMRQAYGEADATWQLRRRTMPGMTLPDRLYLDHRLRAAQDHYLVLKINRQSILSDAFDQLWHRQKSELLRPLRVRMGIDEGEIGHDLGGVQIEFFKLACQEAFDPEYSMFITDPQTRLAWFQPATLIPLYKYQLFGMLFGLAVYNGITLPVSFPLAFYKKLLFQPNDEFDLREGWPSLSRSLQYLLNHQGSVEEDFSREYVFSFSANGLHLDVAMDDPWNGWSIQDKIRSGKGFSTGLMKVFRAYPDKHHPGPTTTQETTSGSADPKDDAEVLEDDNPTAKTPAPASQPFRSNIEWPGWNVQMLPPGEEPQLVTNDNRHQYRLSYAKWLMDWSIRPQFMAFAKGFYGVMDFKPLMLLNANQFRTLVEGHNHLDIDALQRAATYVNYTASTPVIRWFWEVVKTYPQQKQKQLLEFVTASSRVPVNGAESLIFVIERSDAETSALPGSSTCFGTLRLPEYESKKVLKTKLDIALEHSLGFGQA